MDDERYARSVSEASVRTADYDDNYEDNYDDNYDDNYNDSRDASSWDQGRDSQQDCSRLGQDTRGSAPSSGSLLPPALLGALGDVQKKLGLGALSNRTAVILVLAVCLLLVFAVSSYAPGLQNLLGGSGGTDTATLLRAEEEADLPPEADSAESASTAGILYVHVSGAVRSPGVYQLTGGARAVDALNAAGGFLPEAAHEAVNLAALVEDGMQLHVLTQEEFDQQGGIAIMPTSGSGGQAAGGGSSGHDSAGLVNVNTADSATLQTLPGVGPVTADNIVKDREANGPYSSLEDLTRVSGIGPKRVEALQGIASVGN
ncbi:MAG: ComEA family DNA-binding protein [Coriobacteriia bacterium]|nr:ComEA family DNA-binding protein [Coriobacteriia bacterium]